MTTRKRTLYTLGATLLVLLVLAALPAYRGWAEREARAAWTDSRETPAR